MDVGCCGCCTGRALENQRFRVRGMKEREKAQRSENPRGLQRFCPRVGLRLATFRFDAGNNPPSPKIHTYLLIQLQYN